MQKVIYCIINPLIKDMIRVGITPNIVTFVGFLLNVVASAMLIVAAECEDGDLQLCLVGDSGAVILFAGLFDMMDGRLAPYKWEFR